MPKLDLEDIFVKVDKCFENRCKVNKKNIKKVFKPDNGFKDELIKRKIFGSNLPKICDCIIVCDNDNLIVIEILCGKLTYSELKDKKEQLENCCKVLRYIDKQDLVKKVFLLYDKLESKKRQPQLRKALLNQKICGYPLSHLSGNSFDIGC